MEFKEERQLFGIIDNVIENVLIEFNKFIASLKYENEEIMIMSLSSVIEPDFKKENQVLLFPSLDNKRVIFYSKVSDGFVNFFEGFLRFSNDSGYFFSVSDNAREYPCNYLKVYEHEGVLSRMVRSMKDSGGWEFFEKGEVLSFEKDYSKTRRIKDKLSKEIVIEYLKELGFSYENEIKLREEFHVYPFFLPYRQYR